MVCFNCGTIGSSMWKRDPNKKWWETPLLCLKCKELGDAQGMKSLAPTKVRAYMPKPVSEKWDHVKVGEHKEYRHIKVYAPFHSH